MKHFVKTNVKRITAAILCAVMCIAALPFSAFAFTAEEGKKVDAYYGAKYVGYDGEKYHSPATYQYITYDSGGNVSLHSKKAGGARSKLMIKDSSGARQVLCIESGVDYNAKGTYTSESGKSNSYFQNLPAAVQYGLMLTSVYGWHPGKTAPVSGTNEDDFAIATQKYSLGIQQQLRTSPTSLAAKQPRAFLPIPTTRVFRADPPRSATIGFSRRCKTINRTELCFSQKRLGRSLHPEIQSGSRQLQSYADQHQQHAGGY